METEIIRNGSEIIVAVKGRLNTLTAPQLEKELKTAIGDADKLIFDFAGLEYISSAGLRVLLSSMQIMNGRGGMVLRNVRPDVLEVFEVTGFIDSLDIE